MQNLISNTRLLDLGAPLPTIGDPSHFDSANLTDRAEVRRSSASSGSLVFIDSTVKNYQSLAAGAGAGQEIFFLDAAQDGVAQISAVLSDRTDIASLHIVSHGSAGSLKLGSATLDLSTLGAYSSELQTWAKALAAHADILLYGCDVAAADGGRFIQQLSNLTGADLAASIDPTGSAALGGNWVLESQTGTIEAGLAFANSTMADYDAILPTLNLSDFSDTSSLKLNGNASQVGGVLRLTPAQTMQAGSAFFNTPFDINGNTSFQTRFRFRLGEGNGVNGADGFTFILQNSAAGVNALGGTGGSLGYGIDLSPNSTAIGRSLAIEFDTYRNPNDLNGNHVAVLQNGNAAQIYAIGMPSFDLNSGNAINAWIDYDAAIDQLKVFLSETAIKPNVAILSYTVDLSAIVGDRAFVGFSAGTGGAVNNQDIENIELVTSIVTPDSGTGTPGTGNGLKGEYFDNRDFTDLIVTRIDPTVNFDWAAGSPAPGVAPDTFSVRWTGQVQALSTGNYTFFTSTDDGVRLSVNGQTLINRFVDQSTKEYNGTIALVAGQKYDIQMEYYDNGFDAVSRLLWAGPGVAKQVIPTSQLYSTIPPVIDPGPVPDPGTGNGLKGEYYDNIDFTNLALTRTDANVNFDWAEGSPSPVIGPDTFSVRWTGQVEALYSETYTFFTSTDDGVRLFVNGQQIINRFVDQGTTEHRGTIALVAGQKYDIRLEYYDNTFDAVARLGWSSARQARQIIPKSQLYSPAVVNTGTIVLGQNAVTVNENDGTATIRVDRVNGSDGAASVNYTTVNENGDL
ncbi:MAG: DUF4347 domain-containing protein [Leptolyngbyaceae cyanobacterium SU_3_3]|nr:DUF4347 domain-containing protein [Leptolyngbyaceae cyanobacterium SU_3_3]